jgi:hypothetical protein
MHDGEVKGASFQVDWKAEAMRRGGASLESQWWGKQSKPTASTNQTKQGYKVQS